MINDGRNKKVMLVVSEMRWLQQSPGATERTRAIHCDPKLLQSHLTSLC